jgi:hypothetical protein
LQPLADMNPKGPKRRWKTLEILGLAIGLVSVVVSIVFGIRAEKAKALVLQYSPARPLLALQANNLQVNYDGKVARRPYILSARLENTGSVPIEERDIERPLVLRFRNAKVLGAEISERRPIDLSGVSKFDESTVTLVPRLMNPGDSFAFDVVFDGVPAAPDASVRISGLLRLEIGEAAAANAKVSLLQLPRSVTIMVLGLGTAFTSLVVFAAFVGFGGAARSLLWGKPLDPLALERASTILDSPFDLGLYSTVSKEDLPTDVQKIVDATSGGVLEVDLVDQPHVLRAQLERSADALSSIGATVDGALVRVVSELRRVVPLQTATAMWQQLPYPLDSRARSIVTTLPFTEQTLRQFIDKAQAAIQVIKTPEKGWRAVEFDDLTMGATCTVLGLDLAIVLAGAWKVFVFGS